VVLGEPTDPAALAALAGHGGVTTEVVPLHGDLFSTLALLSALLARRAVRDAASPLAALAERLHAARYAVIVGQTARLPAQGALIIEGVYRIVSTLNATTRAGAMWLGGGNGAGTVNEVFTWLSGLPLRSRAGPAGLEHEPLCFDAVRLLADAAVDCLLWISSFDATCAPPSTPTPLVVLGHPDLASSAARIGSVFIPVSTPGIGSAGHLFRADGGAVLPLVPVYRDTLPMLADVLGGITQGVTALRAEAGS
jgi:formylmethanofuran dehydrogenase subunit B